MDEPRPQTLDSASPAPRVLFVALHDGELLAEYGAALAFHLDRGDTVRALVLAAGSEGREPSVEVDPAAPLAEPWKRVTAAGGRSYERASLALRRGRLGAGFALVRRLRAELAAFEPELVHAPSEEASDGDRLAAARCATVALARGPRRRVLLYGAGAQGVRESESTALRATFAGNARASDPWAATAVISNWNKREDLAENLDGLRSQMRRFAEVVVVDNASSDGSARMVEAEFPEVRLIEMPHSAYGACETFNVGFVAARTPLIAILDDDVVLPPEWLERTLARLEREPASTAVVSTEVTEPGMPASFLDSAEVARERYMSTFRGCASLARTEALRRAEWYDERLFIYGNERDLTCRLLNLGYRVLHYPAVRAFHKTPFGIKMGRRSLYYHARNAWITMLKYAPLGDLVRLPWLVLSRVLLRNERAERAGEVSDATGTIGIGRSIRETPGAWWVLTRAGLSVLANVPYCLRRRAPVRAVDFELPLR